MAQELSRRDILRSATSAGAIALAGPLGLLAARNAEGRTRRINSPYGPVFPQNDLETGLPLLQLPQGFVYRSFGWTGDLMSDGAPTPPRHDGMAVVRQLTNRFGDLVLMRNHENGPGPLVGGSETPVFDDFAAPALQIPALGGGTTALTIRRGRLIDDRGTLAGTLTNCAGGPTPWGSWITCEEGVVNGTLIGAQVHGWCYDVPAPSDGQASAQPIVDMGLMDHEAVAVDPRTGFVYETEDNSNFSGFYRFRPDVPGDLVQGGTLEMLRVIDAPNADLRAVTQGQAFATDWVAIDDPSALPANAVSPGPGLPPILFEGASGPYQQGFDNGAAQFRRGEGAWYHNGVIYWVDTSGGPSSNGVIWAYEPELTTGKGTGRLSAVFVSTDGERADNPDNITLSRDGGVLFCEDNGRAEGTRLISLMESGDVYEFGRNNMNLTAPLPGRPAIEPMDYRPAEFAGACFDPSGRYLFVNIQTPGVTFVITGPWKRGNLT